MPSYPELTKTFANKVKNYTVRQCQHAIVDINETLDAIGDDLTDGYVVQKYCELDAVRDRLMALRKHN